MIKTNAFENVGSRRIAEKKDDFAILEYTRDISVSPLTAQTAYYAAKMNVRKRQLLVNLTGNKSLITQAGAMQMLYGNVTAATDVKGVGDLAKKMFNSKAAGESAIKPKYSGNGQIVLEPTYKYILLEDIASWQNGMVIDDGLFLACDGNVDITTVMRNNLSSAVLGGEGLFNTCLVGTGVAALESPVPREELIEIILDNDVVKIDGNFAIAWSNSLQFTVEKTTKSLIGSAASGEGFVNVYKGSGRILVAPIG